MKRYLIWIIGGTLALLVVVGVPGAITYLMLTRLAPAGAVPGSAAAPDVKVTKENVIALKPFVTNLADPERPRYINVTLELILQDSGQKDTVIQRVPLIRDTVLALLGAKKSIEVTGEAGANTLKTELLLRLNGVLGGKYVQKVLITDLVVQH